MTFGAEIWGPALIQAAGSIGGGLLSGQGSKSKESKMERTKRKLVDQLIASLGGDGPFSDLFASDEAAFQKSFVDPAKSMFKNQIAPQIQQSYIASGQQRGTGLDDALMRAGVDLDQMLNQQYYGFTQDALGRKQNAIGNILGQPNGTPPNSSTGQDVMSSISGYLSSPGFADTTAGLFKKPPTAASAAPTPPRKGFEQDYMNWNLGDPRWGRQ